MFTSLEPKMQLGKKFGLHFYNVQKRGRGRPRSGCPEWFGLFLFNPGYSVWKGGCDVQYYRPWDKVEEEDEEGKKKKNIIFVFSYIEKFWRNIF